MVLMDRGRLVASGRIDDLMSRSGLRELIGAEDLGTMMTATVDGHVDGLVEIQAGNQRLYEFPGVQRVAGRA